MNSQEAANASQVCSLVDTVILLAKGGCSQASPDEEFAGAIAHLQLANVAPYFISPIQFNFTNTDQLAAAMAAPTDWSGIILTSTRCVDALVQCFQDMTDRTGRLEQWSRLKIFSVGETTRRHLYAKLQLESIGHQSGNAASLAAFILRQHAVERFDKPLVYPCSSIRSDSISELLRGKLPVEEIVCYETVANRQAGQEVALFRDYLTHLAQRGTVAKIKLLVVFFSPSGVENLLPHLMQSCLGVDVQISNQLLVKFIAFGKVTAARMAECGLDVWFVASTPKPQALVADLSGHLADLSNQ